MAKRGKTIKSLQGEYRDSGARTQDRRIIYNFFRTGRKTPSEYTYIKTTKSELASARKRRMGVALFRTYGSA